MFIPSGTAQINLGILHDCTSVTPIGVFGFPTLKDCKHNMDENKEMKVWKGKVRKYQPKTTHFYIYLCSLEYISLRCDEKGIEAFEPEQYRTVKKIKLTPEEAENMMVMKTLLHDNEILELESQTGTHWKSTKTKDYDCHWGQDNTVGYYSAEMFKYPAQITGDSTTIEQHVFSTSCAAQVSKRLSYTWCTTNTDTSKILVWNDPKHDPTLLQDLGTHEIKQIDDFILIESLVIGGAIQQESDKYKGIIQLDNGIVITEIGVKETIYKKLKRNLEGYAKMVGTDVMAPILEAHLAAAMVQQNHDMIRDWERICFIQDELQKIQKWMIHTFPTSSARWVHQKSGVVVHPAGDAMHISRCMEIEDYTILFNRTVNETCYRDFPVINEETKSTKFLRIIDRQLIAISPKVNCSERTQHTYLKAENGTYYLITAEGDVKEANISQDTAKEPHDTNLKKLRGYHPEWIVKVPEHLEPYAIMDILSYTHDAINEVKNLQSNHGGGNLLVGIARTIGAVFEEAADGTSKVIKAIGGGLKDVFEGVGDMDEKIIDSIGTATSEVIDSTGGAIEKAGTGLGNIFHGFFGGIGGTIKWGIILLLIIGFIYMNRESIRRTICKPKKPEDKTGTTSNTKIESEKTKKKRLTFNPKFLKTIAPRKDSPQTSENPQPTNV